MQDEHGSDQQDRDAEARVQRLLEFSVKQPGATFAEVLRWLRANTGQAQRTVARAIHRRAAYLADLEQGSRGPKNRGEILAIGAALALNVEDVNRLLKAAQQHALEPTEREFFARERVEELPKRVAAIARRRARRHSLSRSSNPWAYLTPGSRLAQPLSASIVTSPSRVRSV